jgi:hypothetical protein
MTRVRLLPHVFVAGHRRLPPPAAYISGRALRAAIAANAALMTFAGDDDATRAPGGHDPFATPAHAPGTAGAAAPNATPVHAPANPPDSAPATPGRDIAA